MSGFLFCFLVFASSRNLSPPATLPCSFRPLDRFHCFLSKAPRWRGRHVTPPIKVLSRLLSLRFFLFVRPFVPARQGFSPSEPTLERGIPFCNFREDSYLGIPQGRVSLFPLLTPLVTLFLFDVPIHDTTPRAPTDWPPFSFITFVPLIHETPFCVLYRHHYPPPSVILFFLQATLPSFVIDTSPTRSIQYRHARDLSDQLPASRSDSPTSSSSVCCGVPSNPFFIVGETCSPLCCYFGVMKTHPSDPPYTTRASFGIPPFSSIFFFSLGTTERGTNCLFFFPQFLS